MQISQRNLLFRWIFLSRIIKGRPLPQRINLCPFFWRMIFSPVVNLILLPLTGLVLLFWTALIWVGALLFGCYVSYWDYHWDKKNQSFVKNHWFWNAMKPNLYPTTSSYYRDSQVPWTYKRIPWLPRIFELPIVVGAIFALAYVQIYGWMTVYHGYIWRWGFEDFFSPDTTGLVDRLAVVFWLLTTTIALVVGGIFLLLFTYDSKVGETVREFAKAKKQGLCPEIEVVP